MVIVITLFDQTLKQVPYHLSISGSVRQPEGIRRLIFIYSTVRSAAGLVSLVTGNRREPLTG
ncbi:MAG TPA: hypothetical protein VLH40_10515 [Atribacteraceae bacterium]|nr:hypothetical protein [Atribacteraceae bacterium]